MAHQYMTSSHISFTLLATLIFDNKSKRAVMDDGKSAGANIEPGKAYLQKLYDVIGDL